VSIPIRHLAGSPASPDCFEGSPRKRASRRVDTATVQDRASPSWTSITPWKLEPTNGNACAYDRSLRSVPLPHGGHLSHGPATNTASSARGSTLDSLSALDGASGDPCAPSSCKAALHLCRRCEDDGAEAQNADKVTYIPIHRWTAEEVLVLTLDSLIAARRALPTIRPKLADSFGEAVGRVHESGVLPRAPSCQRSGVMTNSIREVQGKHFVENREQQ
jgi:hypothetical protein